MSYYIFKELFILTQELEKSGHSRKNILETHSLNSPLQKRSVLIRKEVFQGKH